MIQQQPTRLQKLVAFVKRTALRSERAVRTYMREACCCPILGISICTKDALQSLQGCTARGEFPMPPTRFVPHTAPPFPQPPWMQHQCVSSFYSVDFADCTWSVHALLHLVRLPSMALFMNTLVKPPCHKPQGGGTVTAMQCTFVCASIPPPPPVYLLSR